MSKRINFMFCYMAKLFNIIFSPNTLPFITVTPDLNYTEVFCIILALHGERSWPSGQGVGLRTLGSWVRSPQWAWFALKLRQFHLPRFASVYSAANEYQHCWGGTCDGLASRLGESVQLYSNCLQALNETRFKHWSSLAFMAYLRQLSV